MSGHKRTDTDLFNKILSDVNLKSRMPETKKHIQHGNTSVYMHSVAVAFYSYRAAQFLRLRVNKKMLIRGALLHDYFLYDWHEKDASHSLHGFYHPGTSLLNASRDFALSKIEKDIISRHMFPLTWKAPRYTESVTVCIVDKMCSVYEILYLNKFFHLYDVMESVKG